MYFKNFTKITYKNMALLNNIGTIIFTSYLYYTGITYIFFFFKLNFNSVMFYALDSDPNVEIEPGPWIHISILIYAAPKQWPTVI